MIAVNIVKHVTKHEDINCVDVNCWVRIIGMWDFFWSSKFDELRPCWLDIDVAGNDIQHKQCGLTSLEYVG